MPVIFVSHAELYRRKAQINPRHTKKGYQRIQNVARMLKRFVDKDQQGDGLKVLFSVEGYRSEDVLREIRHAFFPEAVPPEVLIGIDQMLGGASSRRSQMNNLVRTPGNNTFSRGHCLFLSDCISVPYAWRHVKKIDKMHDGYKVLCGGRQFLTMLGRRDEFRIASAWILDWQKRELACIIRRGTPLVYGLT